MSIDVGAVDRTKGSGTSSLRPTVGGVKHMASAGHYLAAEAAFQILEAGGNAVDAGVAASMALAVVQSDFVNIAGVAPILVYQAEKQQVWSISGLGWWPRAASVEFFVKEFAGHIPVGILRTVVPAAPEAWITALDRFGTMSFADTAAAAIRFAQDGFVMYPLMAEMIASNEAGYRRWSSSEQVYLPDGAPPRVGSVFRQVDLAGTIRYMADCEKAAAGGGRSTGLRAARDAFYRGDIARTIVAYHEKHGGFLSMRDLEGFAVEIERPQRTTYGRTEIFSCGFWCQGPALLQMLNMAELADVGALAHNSADYVHTLVEIMKLALADRDAYYGDPRFVAVPGERLLSKGYARERIARIDPASAFPGCPAAGTPQAAVLVDAGTDPTLDTSYVAVVDRYGNAFSATPSDASNNTPVIPGTGLCPSSRGSQSWAVPGHPATVQAGRRPRLTPNPAIAIRAGEFVMPFGSPGGDVQTQAMLQVFLNIEQHGMTLQQAVEAPRFATFSFPSSFEPHGAEPDRLMVENGVSRAAVDALRTRGHDVRDWGNYNWRGGAVCVVKHDVASGVRAAGADPRRPSYAVGW